MAEFPIPSFIEEATTENIHQKILSYIPDDIDKSEGSFVWDIVSRPAARMFAYLMQYALIEGVKIAFPRYSYGSYLDELAKSNSLQRKTATHATGKITVTGTAGVSIPVGSVFSTESKSDTESIDFETTEKAVIGEDGTVDIAVQCTEAGINGNVSVGTIIMKSSDLPDGITAVTNAEPTVGGTDEEDDESLTERIESVEQSKSVSFVGSVSDYKRWAESVDGVGRAKVIPAQDNSGMVTIVLTDANGDPASETLCQAVYDYIIGVKEDESDRMTNINGNLLTVKAPEIIPIPVGAYISLDNTVSLSEIKTAFIAALSEYFVTANSTGTIKYSEICSLLLAMNGVDDYSDVGIGRDFEPYNVSLEKDQIAVVDEDNICLEAW